VLAGATLDAVVRRLVAVKLHARRLLGGCVGIMTDRELNADTAPPFELLRIALDRAEGELEALGSLGIDELDCGVVLADERGGDVDVPLTDVVLTATASDAVKELGEDDVPTKGGLTCVDVPVADEADADELLITGVLALIKLRLGGLDADETPMTFVLSGAARDNAALDPPPIVLLSRWTTVEAATLPPADVVTLTPATRRAAL